MRCEPMPPQTCGQRELAYENGAPKKGPKPSTVILSEKLGKLYLTKASDRSYIQSQLDGQKKSFLCCVTAKQVGAEHHLHIAQTLRQQIVDEKMDKDASKAACLKAIRESQEA